MFHELDNAFWAEVASAAGPEGVPEECRLWILWNELPAGSLLPLAGGGQVTILSPGTWNVGAGPDFRQAEIQVAGETRRGDVEIHRQSRDWEAHGHTGDPRYSRVVLHVVWDISGGAAGGPPGVPCAGLGHLSAPETSLVAGPFSRLELFPSLPPGEKEWPSAPDSGYPYAQKVGAGKCAEVWAGRSDEEIRELLERASERRLEMKIRRCRLEVMALGLEQALYRRLLEALGYQSHREWFLRLSERCPLETLWPMSDDEARLALLSGAGGILPDPTCTPVLPELEGWLCRLWRHWWNAGGLVVPLARPSAPGRPWNSPERRLWAAWELFRRWEWRPARRFQGLAGIDDGRQLLEELEAPLCFESRWAGFLGFSSRLARPVELLGQGRRRDMVANVLLPWMGMLAGVSGNGPALAAVFDGWRRLPRLQANRPLAEAVHRFLIPPSRARRLLKLACHQQGLLLFYREFCTPLCRCCGKCPGYHGFSL